MLYQGRRLLPEGDLDQFIVKKIEQAVLPPDSVIFLPSPLKVEIFNHVLQHLPPSSYLVWMEIEPALYQSTPKISHPQLIEWNPSLSPDQLPLPWLTIRKVVELSLTGGRNLHSQAYLQFFHQLEAELGRQWKNRLTWQVLGPRWSQNLWENLLNMRPTPPFPIPQPKTLPLVLGAGPSVEADLELIRKYRSQLWILAVDSILPTLLELEIQPDLVAVLESQIINIRDFASAVGQKIPLVIDLSAHPSHTKILKGPTLWTVTEFAPLKFFTHLKKKLPLLYLPPLGSVGNYALQFALDIWQGTVLVGGLDFHFPPGKTHARGSAHHRALEASHHRLNPLDTPGFEVPSKPGNLPGLRTTPNLEVYATLFSHQAKGRVQQITPEAFNQSTANFQNTFRWNEPSIVDVKNFTQELFSQMKTLQSQIQQGKPDLELLNRLDIFWFWEYTYLSNPLNPLFLKKIEIQIRRLLKYF